MKTVVSPLREAQRAGVQLLSALSRQFRSDEMHIVFDEGVKLSWEGDHTSNGTGAESMPGQAGQGSQPEESPGGVGQRRGFARGLSSAGSSDMPPSGSAATATGGQEEGLSLTLFLSNVVLACCQVSCSLPC